jgi:hypothetical protein
MIKRITIAAILAVSTFTSAYAAGTGSTSSSSGTVNASTAAQNAGNAQNINFNSAAQSDLRTVPNVSGNNYYGSFSQDGCMVSGGIGLSVLGFGANGVTPIRDGQCDLRLSFQRVEQAAAMQPTNAAKLHQAADDILCALGGPVYQALKNQGICSDNAVRQAEGNTQKVAVSDNVKTIYPPKPVAAVEPVPQVAPTPVAMNTVGNYSIQKLPVQQPTPMVQSYVIDSTGTHPIGNGQAYTGSDPAILAKLGMK